MNILIRAEAIEKEYNEPMPPRNNKLLDSLKEGDYIFLHQGRFPVKFIIIKFFQEIGGVLKYARASADLTICMLFEMAEKEMRLECDDEGCGVQTPHNSFYDLILK